MPASSPVLDLLMCAVLDLQMCAATLDLFGAGDPAKGFLQAWDELQVLFPVKLWSLVLLAVR